MIRGLAISGLVLMLLTQTAELRASESPEPANRAVTGKERLSDKASDEQRVDNCNVPADRRGSKPRPDCREAEGKGVSPPGRLHRTAAATATSGPRLAVVCPDRQG